MIATHIPCGNAIQMTPLEMRKHVRSCIGHQPNARAWHLTPKGDRAAFEQSLDRLMSYTKGVLR
jgi:hypothetical protein